MFILNKGNSFLSKFDISDCNFNNIRISPFFKELNKENLLYNNKKLKEKFLLQQNSLLFSSIKREKPLIEEMQIEENSKKNNESCYIDFSNNNSIDRLNNSCTIDNYYMNNNNNNYYCYNNKEEEEALIKNYRKFNINDDSDAEIGKNPNILDKNCCLNESFCINSPQNFSFVNSKSIRSYFLAKIIKYL